MLYVVEPCLWADVFNAHRLPATNFEVSVICLQMVHTVAAGGQLDQSWREQQQQTRQTGPTHS